MLQGGSRKRLVVELPVSEELQDQTHGMKYILATTWSNPSATKINTGIQSAIIFDATSLAPAVKEDQ
jgi:hypothetical protein